MVSVLGYPTKSSGLAELVLDCADITQAARHVL
jgi:hypothetical protein